MCLDFTPHPSPTFTAPSTSSGRHPDSTLAVRKDHHFQVGVDIVRQRWQHSGQVPAAFGQFGVILAEASTFGQKINGAKLG